MASNFEAALSLLSVVVGAVKGFLGSIGFDRWKEGRKKKELKSRIREELEIIFKEVSDDLEKRSISASRLFH